MNTALRIHRVRTFLAYQLNVDMLLSDILVSKLLRAYNSAGTVETKPITITINIIKHCFSNLFLAKNHRINVSRLL